MPTKVRTDSAKLALLAALSSADSVAGISELTGYNRTRIRRVSRELADQGLVTRHKQGREVEITPSSRSLASHARELVEDFPNQDWGSVLHGDRPLVLHVLDRLGRVRETAEVVGQTPSGVRYTAQSLAEAGILVHRDGGHRFHPRHRALKGFVDEWAKLRAHHRVEGLDPSGYVLWYLGPETLLKSDEPDLEGEDVHQGAFSAFHEYGVPLITGSSYYVVSERDLDAADAILQGLLAEPDSPVHRSYCALVYEKALPENLVRKARIYGLEEEARALRSYVREQEAHEGFLPWEEHTEYREQYGVA